MKKIRNIFDRLPVLYYGTLDSKQIYQKLKPIQTEPGAKTVYGDVAKQPEKQVIGCWAPDVEAMVKLIIEEEGIKEEDRRLRTHTSGITFLEQLRVF